MVFKIFKAVFHFSNFCYLGPVAACRRQTWTYIEATPASIACKVGLLPELRRGINGPSRRPQGEEKLALSFGGLFERIGFLDARRRAPGRHGIWRRAAGLCCRPGIEDRGDSQYTGPLRVPSVPKPRPMFH